MKLDLPMLAFSRSLLLPILLCASLTTSSTTALAQDRNAKAEALVKDLSDASKKVRLQALALMVDRDHVGIVPESALEPLLKLASDEDADIRGWTMSALGMLGSKHIEMTRPALLKGLDDVPMVATPAAIAIGRLKDAKSVKTLVPLTEQKEGFARHYAAEALSAIGGKEAKDAVLKYAQQTAPELLKTLKESGDEVVKIDAEMFLSRMLRSMSRVGLQASPEAKEISEALH